MFYVLKKANILKINKKCVENDRWLVLEGVNNVKYM